MEQEVYNFRLNLDWELVRLISEIDRFDAAWSSIERKEGQSLKQLKTVATVRSVGASTRIEGSVMSDEEVEVLLDNIDITKLEERDEQEVAGYFEALDFISDTFEGIDISENNLKHLHKMLMRHNTKDHWHAGNYKKHSNAVEAKYPDGRQQVIFRTTEPGFPTQDAMSAMVQWHETDENTHALVKSALFAYEFLSIHPFQDGNGRLSRLLSTLLLLKNGYKWIEYVSFEHEIESRKSEYYRALRNCQSQRPNENVTEWVNFFFDALRNIQEQLLLKLEEIGIDTQLAPREKAILAYISGHPGCKSGDISKRLGIPGSTAKRILHGLLAEDLIEKHGVGPGTNYTLK